VTLTEIADAVAGVQASVNSLGGAPSAPQLVFGLSIPGLDGDGDAAGIIDPDDVLVYDYALEFEIPTSPGPGGSVIVAGAPGVKRFSLLVNVDTAYPSFYDAIALSGQYPSLRVEGYDVSSGGLPQVVEIVETTDARIIGLEETTTPAGERALRLDFLVFGQICIERISPAGSFQSCYTLAPQP
jgi:hypothetical protein